MVWYDKYYNKISKNGNFWIEEKTEKLFEAASKVTHPQNSGSTRWYDYYYNEDLNKYIRVTKRMRDYGKFRRISKKEAEDKYPEYFI
jgi:hypothetical protein